MEEAGQRGGGVAGVGLRVARSPLVISPLAKQETRHKARRRRRVFLAILTKLKVSLSPLHGGETRAFRKRGRATRSKRNTPTRCAERRTGRAAAGPGEWYSRKGFEKTDRRLDVTDHASVIRPAAARCARSEPRTYVCASSAEDCTGT